MRQHARAAMDHLSWPGVYLITAYDGKGCVKVNVQIDPTQPTIESNWMPLGCIGVGNGWGIAVGPQIGDQVLCVFEGGDFSSGVVVARLFSTQAQPMPVPAGEIWNVHSSGSSLKFTNDGKVTLVPEAGFFVTGNTTLNGTLTVNGNVATIGTLQNNGHAVGSTHQHSGVSTGSSNTGAPL